MEIGLIIILSYKVAMLFLVYLFDNRTDRFSYFREASRGYKMVMGHISGPQNSEPLYVRGAYVSNTSKQSLDQ